MSEEIRLATRYEQTSAVLGAFGCLHLTASGTVQHNIDCPFCHGKRCASLWPKGHYRCWRADCGIHGDAWDILRSLGFDWGEAKAFLADECSIHASIPRKKRYVPSWSDHD